ncbi:MacB-like core domain-containing protein [Clostridium cavendishii DSM 21758]|uniref:MacB-like core domain-containing protein n=1 Tax=Clostridium cavendishii DSM 21758 TaxID=1121302 RepID=A0A1M6I840_9CLOT|nr:FtsX-like permease family protein [Clostridium cavendishii]SHJ30612.1 MacB-like core domain-containing protein [Clostridium cavendishii DSM 21758]
MRGYLELANRNLIRHKKNTLVCIIGIIIGTVIMTITSIIYEAENNTLQDSLKKAIGFYDVRFENLNKEQVEKLKKDKRVSNTAIYKKVGVSEIEGRNIKQYCDVLALGEDAYNKVFNLDIIAGRRPENGNEILMENAVALNMESSVKIGDIVELDILTGKVEANDLNNNYIYNEMKRQMSAVESYKIQSVIEKKEKKKYKLVGIFQSPEEYSNQAINMFTKLNAEDINSMNSLDLFALVNLQVLLPEQRIADDLGIKYIPKTKFTPLPQGNIDSQIKFVDYTSVKKTHGGLGFLGAGIIMFVIGIFIFGVTYNVFNISIAERLRQFGILRAIGATRRQLGMLVFYEAFVECIIGITIGIMLGIINTKGLLFVFSKVLNLDFSYINVSLSLFKLIIIIVIMFFIVMLAAYIALFKDSILSPIQSMSEVTLLNIKNLNETKNYKKVKKIKKMFNIEGELAYKNLSRNEKRNKKCLKSISVSMVIILFFFCQVSFYKVEKVNVMPSSKWDINYLRINSPIFKEDISNLKRIQGVEEVYSNKTTSLGVPIEKNKVNNKVMISFESYMKNFNVPERCYKNYYALNTLFRGVDEKSLDLYKSNLKEGELNYNKLKDNGIIIVNSGTTNQAINRGFNVDYEFYDMENILNVKVGDKLKIPIREKLNNYSDMEKYFNNDTSDFKEFTVLAIVDKDVFLDNMSNRNPKNLTHDVTFITANEVFDKEKIDTTSNLFIKTNKSLNREDILKGIGQVASVHYDSYTDFYSRMVDYNNSVTRSLCWDINFAINILIIVIINIMNTFNANILIRNKEFGALRAIGTTKKQLNNMLLLEVIFLGIVASVFGLIFGSFPACLSQMSMNNFNKSTFSMIVIITCLTIIALIIICVLSTLIPLRKLKNLSIVDNIRNEE